MITNKDQKRFQQYWNQLQKDIADVGEELEFEYTPDPGDDILGPNFNCVISGTVKYSDAVSSFIDDFEQQCTNHLTAFVVVTRQLNW